MTGRTSAAVEAGKSPEDVTNDAESHCIFLVMVIGLQREWQMYSGRCRSVSQYY